nr:hypothetical protein [Armatimonas sp.]
MRVRLRELEAGMAQRVGVAQQGLAAVPEKTTLEPIWSVFSLLCSLAICALYILVCFRVGGAVAVFLLLLSPGILLAATNVSRARAPRHVGAPALRVLLAEPSLLRVERLYSEALLMLLETPAKQPAPLRALLQDINQLVKADRTMATQQSRLRAATDPQALRGAEIEYQQLIERLACESDPVAHAALTESLDLCEERLTHLRALPLLLHRLDAQRELLCQGVALAHAALLRTRTTPLALIPPELTTLRARVRQLTSESRALEEATQSLQDLQSL